MNRQWRFPVERAARYVAPDSDGSARFEDWMLWVKAGDLPLDFPLDPNARYPDITRPTPKAIEATLRDEPDEFVRRNTGLCMVARACTVHDGRATVVLRSIDEAEEDTGRRGDGVLNGGHTYAVVKKVVAEAIAAGRDAPDPDPRRAVVRVEVQTGVGEDDLVDISRARNRAEPVKDHSFMDLDGSWEALKNVLPPEWRARVAFKEMGRGRPIRLHPPPPRLGEPGPLRPEPGAGVTR